MFLNRRIHPVGQGLFCTERFKKDDGHTPALNIIYDCGTLNGQEVLDDAIDKEFKSDAASGKVSIDYMFISHFHKDHISGIDYLKTYCDIKQYVLPVLTTERIAEAYIFNYLHGGRSGVDANGILVQLTELKDDDVKYVNEDGEFVTEIDKADRKNFWLIKAYLPYQPEVKKLENKMKGTADFGSLWNAFDSRDFKKVPSIFENYTEDQKKELRKIYREAYGGDHAYMLTLYSGYSDPLNPLDERNSLYCGDYKACNNGAVSRLVKQIAKLWPMVGTLQVPHHGSKENSCQDLYDDERHCIISYGPYQFKHPHIETIQFILNTQKGRALETLHLVNTISGSLYDRNYKI